MITVRCSTSDFTIKAWGVSSSKYDDQRQREGCAALDSRCGFEVDRTREVFFLLRMVIFGIFRELIKVCNFQYDGDKHI